MSRTPPLSPTYPSASPGGSGARRQVAECGRWSGQPADGILSEPTEVRLHLPELRLPNQDDAGGSCGLKTDK